jgi:hypothetical protein
MDQDKGVRVGDVRTSPAKANEPTTTTTASSRTLGRLDEAAKPTAERQCQTGDNVVLGYD